MAQLLSRKDIAGLTGLTIDQVRKNETGLGITKAKVKVNRRCIRYKAAIAMQEMRKLGWLDGAMPLPA